MRWASLTIASLLVAACTARTFLRMPKQLGDDCLDNAECPEACIGGTCQHYAEGGEVCDEPEDCADGLVCRDDFCSETNACSGCAPTGEWCDAGTCQPCDVDQHCGSACEDCTLQLLTCRSDGTTCEPVPDCTGLPDFVLCSLDTTVTEGVDRWYDICMGEVCVSPGCNAETCNAPGPNFELPDSNQRDCYDGIGVMASCPGTAGDLTCGSTAYCGQDAQYGWDTQNPEGARFTRTVPVANEPVVLDNVTGLTWQGCARGQSGGDCLSGSATTSN